MKGKRAYVKAVDFVRKRPSLSVFGLALIVRMIVVAVIFLTTEGFGLFPDDSFYNRLAIEAASGQTADWDDWSRGLYQRTAAFMLPLTTLYEIFGPVRWIGQFFVAILGALTAGLTCRLALEAGFGQRWSILSGAIIALLPSQVLFSSLTLKDAAVWAVLVGLAFTVAKANRARYRQLLWFLLVAIFLLILMRYLRPHTLVVAFWAGAIATWFGSAEHRLGRGIGAILVLLILPTALGLGPAGVDFITSAGSLEERRSANAAKADTAFVPTADEQFAEEAPTSDDVSAGQFGSEKLVETKHGDSEGIVNDISHLPYGLAVMLVAPFPWWGEENPRVNLAKGAMVFWYPVLLLATIGLFHIAPYRRAMAFPVLVGGGTLLVYALAEGNFGTAYRHRGEFVWVVALLAAVGLKHTVGWIRDRRART